ncbi:MAG: guanosine monophosphate reductase [Deltaproteobacteria bacterium]|nr:guanosine monophosphate reductase [Deltaproteobacteria bacterium]
MQGGFVLSNLKGLTFDDVILVPGYNGIKSRQNVTTTVELLGRTFGIPLVSSNMDTITELEMANAMTDLGGMAVLHRFLTIEDNVKMFEKLKNKDKVSVSIGIGQDGLERAEALIAVGASMICVDVAHGHSKEVNRSVKALREKHGSNILIIAGNVATYAGADYLASAGADVIKVGIGSGSVCSTRIKTGFGVPQLSALQDCRKVDRMIISDGGTRFPSDAVKALAAGADFVMLGGMLAGTDETPGSVIESEVNGSKIRFKRFRGMASKEAQDDFMGGMSDWKTAEGVSMDVVYKGPMKKVILDIMGGIRSGLTYCGALTIKDLQRKAQFMEITQAGRVEGTPHGMDRLDEPSSK